MSNQIKPKPTCDSCGFRTRRPPYCTMCRLLHVARDSKSIEFDHRVLGTQYQGDIAANFGFGGGHYQGPLLFFRDFKWHDGVWSDGGKFYTDKLPCQTCTNGKSCYNPFAACVSCLLKARVEMKEVPDLSDYKPFQVYCLYRTSYTWFRDIGTHDTYRGWDLIEMVSPAKINSQIAAAVTKEEKAVTAPLLGDILPAALTSLTLEYF